MERGTHLIDYTLLQHLYGLNVWGLQQFLKHTVHVRTVVESRCPLLLLRRHVSDALANQTPEVFLREYDAAVLLEAVLEVELEDGPQCFDRVELRAVRRQKHEFDVQLLSQLPDLASAVARVVVEYQHNTFLVGEGRRTDCSP